MVQAFEPSLPTEPSQSALRYVLAVLAAIAALLLRKALVPLLGDDDPYHIAWLAVAFSAWYCGFWQSVCWATIIPAEQRQLEFPISDNSQALIFGSWRHSQFGDRQAGEEVVRLGKSGNKSGNCSGESGYGCEDGAEVPAAGASAERVDAREAVADTR
jgi:hypothetical protein